MTDTEAETARLALAGKLRHKVAEAISNGLLDLHTNKVTLSELHERLMIVADMMIERVAKID